MPSRRVRSRLVAPSTRAMARESGISDRQLRHRDVVRLSRDTYLPRAVLDDLSTRIGAVLLTAPPAAVVSHLTAAQLWDLQIPLQREDERVHLTVATGSAVRGRADRVIHRIPLTDDDVTLHRGLRLTAPERTWRDLAAVLSPPALLAVTDQLLRLRNTPADLERALVRRPTGRGAARARDVLPVADPLAGSPMESVLRWLLHEAGLPRPVLQHRIKDASGRFLAEVDLAWPEFRVLVEFDGEVHRDRSVFVKDLRRQNGIVVAGWTVLRFSSADVLGRPQVVVAQIRDALGW